MTHPINPEQPKKKPSSPLDDVHTAPYADYAARILDGMATEQGSSPLSNVLRTSSEGMVISPEGFTEQEATQQLQRFTNQFDNAQKELFDRKNSFYLGGLQAIYDEESETYVIADVGGAPIEQLHLGSMVLTELYIPPALKGLQLLDCSSNKLTSISKLPPSLLTFMCDFNQLTKLPELPEQLKTLYCGQNQLIALPELPGSIEALICYSNRLATLPELPSSLQDFNCSGNMLTTLPELPPQLMALYCGSNKLIALPELPPQMKELICSHNQLTAFPDTPPNIDYVKAVNNSFDQATIDRLKAKGFRVRL